MSTFPPSEPERPYGAARPTAAWQDPAAAPGWTERPTAPPPPPPAGSPGSPGSPAGAGTWAPPAPGYGQPMPVDPAYQPTTAWPADSRGDAGFRRARPRRTGPSWVVVAPALFASLALSVGVVVLFLADLFVALGAPAGTAGRDRLLQFLAPADLASAVAVVLAVALLTLQRRLSAGAVPVADPSMGPSPSGARVGPAGAPVPVRDRVRSLELVAGLVAAVIVVAAFLRGVVLLTVPHQPGAVKIGQFIAELAVALVAAAAAVWAMRPRR